MIPQYDTILLVQEWSTYNLEIAVVCAVFLLSAYLLTFLVVFQNFVKPSGPLVQYIRISVPMSPMRVIPGQFGSYQLTSGSIGPTKMGAIRYSNCVSACHT
jgi:hypothetical protein